MHHVIMTTSILVKGLSSESWLELDIVYLRAKFDDSSLNHSRDRDEHEWKPYLP